MAELDLLIRRAHYACALAGMQQHARSTVELAQRITLAVADVLDSTDPDPTIIGGAVALAMALLIADAAAPRDERKALDAVGHIYQASAEALLVNVAQAH